MRPRDRDKPKLAQTSHFSVCFKLGWDSTRAHWLWMKWWRWCPYLGELRTSGTTERCVPCQALTLWLQGERENDRIPPHPWCSLSGSRAGWSCKTCRCVTVSPCHTTSLVTKRTQPSVRRSRPASSRGWGTSSTPRLPTLWACLRLDMRSTTSLPGQQTATSRRVTGTFLRISEVLWEVKTKL